MSAIVRNRRSPRTRGPSKVTVPPNSPYADRLPLLFEDEGLEMGESRVHSLTNIILFCGLGLHFAGRPRYNVLTDMNLYYDPREPMAYVSPDAMVVETARPLPEDMTSYEIGKDGPVPLLVGEVLSYRTFQQGDLTDKPTIYAKLGIGEYVLVDILGDFLPRRLLLKRLQSNGTFKDEQDPDGGISSRLGFRLIVDTDGRLRVLNAVTGKPYPRPDEAAVLANQAARLAESLRHAQERIRSLEARLRREGEPKAKKPSTKRRRKK